MTLVIVYLTLAVILLWGIHDSYRVTRAELAGDRAVEDFRRRVAEAKARVHRKFKTDIVCGPQSYSVLLWDAEPVFDDQVEGVLVPYLVATGSSLDQCERQVGEYLRDLALNHGGAIKIEFTDQTVMETKW